MSPQSEQPDASGPQASLSLQSLAPEIVSNIVNQVDETDSLKSLRLVNRSMDAHARRKMFEEVLLTPNPKSIARWKAMVDSDTLSPLVRTALIQTREDLDEHAHDGVDTDEMGDFHDALNALSKFTRLKSLKVAFTEHCLGDHRDSWFLEVNESSGHRFDVLQWIFQAIKDKNEVEGASKIHSLTLRNLQNVSIASLANSEIFSTVMQQLDELHIGMIQEYNEHGPDHDYNCTELQTFPDYLCVEWLKPVAPNLRALSLYSAVDNWGCFPGYFNPVKHSITFPKLETLSLGYYTLAFNDQLDWIFAPENKSLTKLVMHNCMIASIVSIEKDNMRTWKPNTRDWELVPVEPGFDWCDTFRYRTTWSYFFDKIAEGLPNLKEFVFTYAGTYGGRDEKPPYGVQNRHHHTGAEAFPKRYVVFNNGILPTHWPEAEDDGRLEHCLEDKNIPEDVNFHAEFLEEDKKSLGRLLAKCRARRDSEERR
ncbi:putative f-box domain containing protein [Naviculisporaceae sp. PSN 640]